MKKGDWLKYGIKKLVWKKCSVGDIVYIIIVGLSVCKYNYNFILWVIKCFLFSLVVFEIGRMILFNDNLVEFW